MLLYPCWWFMRLLGPVRAARCGSFMLSRIGPRTIRHRKVVMPNLRLVFPDKAEAELEEIGRQSWVGLGSTLGELPHLVRIARSPKLHESIDHYGLAGLAASGRPAVFIGVHLANWEFSALAVTGTGPPLLAIGAPVHNPYISRLVSKTRRGMGCTIVDRGSSDLFKTVRGHLRSGGSLGIFADVKADGGTPVRFLNQRFHTSLIASRLAFACNCPLIPVQVQRLGPARLRTIIHEPLETLPRSVGKDVWVADASRKIYQLFECWIREAPGDWLWANRRWDGSIYVIAPDKQAPA